MGTGLWTGVCFGLFAEDAIPGFAAPYFIHCSSKLYMLFKLILSAGSFYMGLLIKLSFSAFLAVLYSDPLYENLLFLVIFRLDLSTAPPLLLNLSFL